MPEPDSDKAPAPLTVEEVGRIIRKSAKGADELHERLKRVFRLPDRPLPLD